LFYLWVSTTTLMSLIGDWFWFGLYCCEGLLVDNI
jgi:hypothetical protein